MRRALGPALFVALAAAAAGAAGDDPRLAELRRAIEERRERLDAFERKERGLLETLEEMDRTAALVREAEAEARSAAAAARVRAAELAQSEAKLAVALTETREALAVRAVALYKAGELGPLRLLFAADSLPELLTRTRLLRRLLDQDRRLLDRRRAEAAALEVARAESLAAASERDRAQRVLAQRREVLAAERAGRGRLLASVRGDRAQESAALAELEAAARALERQLGRLRSEPPGEGFDFASLRGRLPRPVAGALTRRFGRIVDEEFRTQTFHKGVDFAAALDAPVQSVARGTVRFAGRFRGYGNLVIVDHGGDWFTVSAHLARVDVEKGDAVEAGSRLGTAGDTGSLAGPLLYFELRRGTEAVDPGEWLASGDEG